MISIFIAVPEMPGLGTGIEEEPLAKLKLAIGEWLRLGPVDGVPGENLAPTGKIFLAKMSCLLEMEAVGTTFAVVDNLFR